MKANIKNKTLDVSIIEAFLSNLMPDVDHNIKHLWVTIYRQLAKAKPVSIHTLSVLCNLGKQEIKQHLEELATVSFDDDGNITGFLGLTISKTPHELHTGNEVLYTWCAWDTLFIPEILAKKAVIYSKCPETGVAIRLEVAPDGIERIEPEATIMSFIKISEVGDNIHNNFCCHVHFFSSNSALKKWQETHKNIIAMDLIDAFNLAQYSNQQHFHPRLENNIITNQASSDSTGSIPNIEFNFIKRLNDNVEHYLKKIFLPNEFYEMQQLANKHKVDIKIVDDVTLKQAYKKIALKTHPDKYPAATEDFIKAKQLLEQKESPLPTELYTPIMQKLQKVNIIVEAADTAIDSIRAFKDPSLENVLKVGTGCIHLTSMYTGETGVMLPIAAAGSVYQAYQGDYWEATTSMTKAIGFTLMFSTVYTTAPAVAVVLSAGFTGYATYSMLNNGYELYNEFLEPNPIIDTSSNQDTFDFSF